MSVSCPARESSHIYRNLDRSGRASQEGISGGETVWGRPAHIYESCTSTQANYCQITSPIYFIGSVSNCLIALYMRSENDINKFCTIIINQIQLPNANYLYQGQWVVATTTDIKFTMLCDNINASTSDIWGRSPLTIIQIPM